jgi:hypothetical protein
MFKNKLLIIILTVICVLGLILGIYYIDKIYTQSSSDKQTNLKNYSQFKTKIVGLSNQDNQDRIPKALEVLENKNSSEKIKYQALTNLGEFISSLYSSTNDSKYRVLLSDIDDFAKSKISSAILPNCSVKWILMQPQVDGKRLTEVLNFNENEIATVKSLSQSKGEFSETYLITKDKKAHLRIESTSLEYWIATTDPPDLNAIEAFEKEHPEFLLIDVLKFLSKKYPKGVSASALNFGGAA